MIISRKKIDSNGMIVIFSLLSILDNVSCLKIGKNEVLVSNVILCIKIYEIAPKCILSFEKNQNQKKSEKIF